ncbi:hypothetical protein SCHPADRAFT_929965 [Schizopora paradoxa]|uniref:Uncharacterized protein n=1 Tax=Schizopora paradoxa TaxID=27342 RepID=A0A0H2RHF4_9AGAM|nr:hypothetical protein SCHPADRAFT_929965 [Schizopora paradoxa]
MALNSSNSIEDRQLEYEAPAIESEPEHLDLKALDRVSEIIDRLRLCKITGRFDPKGDWFNLDEGSPPISLGQNPSSAAEDSRSANRVAETSNSLRLAAHTLRKLSALVDLQIQISDSKALSLRLRAGISRIPDEILALILEYAALSPFSFELSESEIVAMVTSNAIRLTHVCKRFRTIGSRVPLFWNRISNGSVDSQISMCCERSTKGNVEISLQSARYLRATGVAPFLQVTKAFSERWSRFTHGCEIPDRVSLVGDELEDLARETYQLQAPVLSELAIHYPVSITLNDDTRLQDPDDVFHYYSTWTVPNLRKFVINHLVSVPFSGSASLTSFSIYLDFKAYHAAPKLTSLVQLLAASPSISTLSLAMRSLVVLESFSMQNIYKFGSVEELNLDLFECEKASVKNFFDHVNFPNVTSSELILSALSRFDWIQDGFHAIFPCSARFPRLTSLYLNYKFSPRETEEDLDVSVLLPVLTSVQNLTLTSHGFGLGVGGVMSKDSCLPSLRSLALKSCYRVRKSFVSRLLWRLKSQGNMPQLMVEDCQWDKRDWAKDSGFVSSGDPEPSDLRSESDTSSISLCLSDNSTRDQYVEKESNSVTVESLLELIT